MVNYKYLTEPSGKRLRLEQSLLEIQLYKAYSMDYMPIIHFQEMQAKV
jgi:hypothetical protein